MTPFETIRARAEENSGGAAALEDRLAGAIVKTPAEIAAMGDDRILSELSMRIFQSGFNWSVVQKKWPGFEEAFHGFDLGPNIFMSDDEFDEHLKNTAIVRHAKKILSIRDNAIFLSDLAKEHGSAAGFFANWPVDNLVGLWDVMKKRGSRLGGATGQYALRFLGKESFILSRDVTAVLISTGVIDKPATSKTALKDVQTAFNAWKAESGENMTRLSRIVAISAG